MKPLILVVEDDAGTQKLLDALLTRDGFQVDIVSSGEQALLLLQHIPYGAVILDLQIRGTTGERVIEELAAKHPELVPRTVLLSARLRLAEYEQMVDLTVMRKPFDIVELLEAVRRMADARTYEPTFEREFIRRSTVAGAKAGIATRVDPSRRQLEIVASFGYAREYVASWSPFAVDQPYPICAAYRNGRGVWLASLNLATREYPSLEGVWRANASVALAALPLTAGDRVVGAVGWTFAEPQPFDDFEQAEFQAIAASVASQLGDGAAQSGARMAT